MKIAENAPESFSAAFDAALVELPTPLRKVAQKALESQMAELAQLMQEFREEEQ